MNLIRNRKGHLPHIVVVTGEPLPSRLSSIALGTGDIDCVYHFALEELINAVDEMLACRISLPPFDFRSEALRLTDLSTRFTPAFIFLSSRRARVIITSGFIMYSLPSAAASSGFFFAALLREFRCALSSL